MNPNRGSHGLDAVATITLVLARWLLGSLFLYMGLNKALHPVEFLKLLRPYDMLQSHILLNLMAATLPWFEIFCGLLLIVGVAVRGTALMLVMMLVPFTAVVAMRALEIHAAGGMPFCAIRFDCGCGTGEVFICGKLIENSLLTLLAAALLRSPNRSLCLRHAITHDPPIRIPGQTNKK
jgi:uncharacterized membrane protein YphA (DoxX/SURF4 family)